MELAGDFLVQVEVRMMNLQSFIEFQSAGAALRAMRAMRPWFSCSDWRMRRRVESWFFHVLSNGFKSKKSGARREGLLSSAAMWACIVQEDVSSSQVDCFQNFLTPCYPMCIVGSFPAGCLTLESWISIVQATGKIQGETGET